MKTRVIKASFDRKILFGPRAEGERTNIQSTLVLVEDVRCEKTLSNECDTHSWRYFDEGGPKVVVICLATTIIIISLVMMKITTRNVALRTQTGLVMKE